MGSGKKFLNIYLNIPDKFFIIFYKNLYFLFENKNIKLIFSTKVL
jgi:hypothetical protein